MEVSAQHYPDHFTPR